MARAIFSQDIDFVAGAQNVGRLPLENYALPEIAFIGKSNVGKSSLINAITNRKALARVSHTPGRTQQINFFKVGESFILVDLPGYGFAKVPHHMRMQWEELIPYYLINRGNLKLINLLIDARRGIKQNDQDIIDLLVENKLPFQILLTKSDAAKGVDQLIKDTLNQLNLCGATHVSVLAVSSRKGKGLVELRGSMLNSLKNSIV